MDGNKFGQETLDKIKDSPIYTVIQNSPFYNLLKVFSSAYSSKIDSFAKENIEKFFGEFQKYAVTYYVDNLMQIISISFFVAFFLLLGLCLTGTISWLQFLLIVMLLVPVSFAILGLYIAYISYTADKEIKKFKTNFENYTNSKIATIQDLIERI